MRVGPTEVAAAADRLAGRVRLTPVIDADVNGVAVALKLELLQHTGSFKPRGAFNRVLSETTSPRRLVAASGGNHGLAVAHVARELGVEATIYVPETTPSVKRRWIGALGANLVVAGRHYQEALEASREAARGPGVVEVHAYDHPATVAGQGTVARELDGQVPHLDTVLVAVGGGGLIAGVCAWFDGRVRVVAVEPATAPTLARAREVGRPVDVDVGGVAADSLGATRIGETPFATMQGRLDRVVLVSDEGIVEAQRRLWAELRLVAEPGGATAFAALVGGAYRPAPGERVAVIVCGANTDPATVTDPP